MHCRAQSGGCGANGVYVHAEDYINYEKASGGDVEVGTDGNLEIGPLGRYEIYGALINKGTIRVDSGAVLSIYGDVSNEDSLIIYKGATVHFYGTIWRNAATAVVSDGAATLNTIPGGVLNFTASRPVVSPSWMTLSGCLSAYSGGNAPQYADGGDVPMDVAFTLNNPNNVFLVNTDTRIEGKLVWAVAGGDVNLGDLDLILTTNATQEGYRPDRFAITSGLGHFVKENFTGTWVFPVGIADNDYTPAAILNNITNTMHVLVQDYASSASDEGVDGPDANGMRRTWNIYADNTPATAVVTLQHNTITNQPKFDNAYNYVTRWGSVVPNPSGDYTASFGMSAWQSNYATAGTPGNLSTTGIVPGSNMNSRMYHDFAVAPSVPEAYFTKLSNITRPQSPELLSFTVVEQDCDPLIEFRTGREDGIVEFQLQRGRDTTSFTVVATFKAKGNNSTYTYLDKEADTGTYYYRVVMILAGGDRIVSHFVEMSIDCRPIILYPNPAEDFIVIDGMREPSQIRIIDMLGRVILAASGTRSKETLDIRLLSSATYIARIVFASNDIVNIKFVKL